MGIEIHGEKMGWDIEKELKWIDQKQDKMGGNVSKDDMGININKEKPEGGDSRYI